MFHSFMEGSGPNWIDGSGTVNAVAISIATVDTDMPDGATRGRPAPTAHITSPTPPHGSRGATVPPSDRPPDDAVRWGEDSLRLARTITVPPD